MEKFKIRASAAGKLLTNPRTKGATLSKTAQTYLEEWTKEQLYGVKKDVESKYLLKGLVCEEDAIDYAAHHFINKGEPSWDLAHKNERHFEDEYFTGTPDVLLMNHVVDIKTSWDCFTFPLFDSFNADYYAQLQVYMHLTGKKHAELVHVLLNTPSEFDRREIDYSGVKSDYRVKRFKFDYDPEIIEKLKSRVHDAREYIDTLLQSIK